MIDRRVVVAVVAAGVALALGLAPRGDAPPVPPHPPEPDRPVAPGPTREPVRRPARSPAREEPAPDEFRRLAGDLFAALEDGSPMPGPAADDSIEGLLAAAREGRLRPEDLAFALRRRLDRRPGEADELAARLAHLGDPTLRFVAVRALAPHAGRPAVRTTVLALLAHGTVEEREAAPFAFLGTADPVVLDRLAGVFLDPGEAARVRASVAYVLADSWDALDAGDARRIASTAAAVAADAAAPRDLRRESLELLAVAPPAGADLVRLAGAARAERDPALRLAFLRVLYPVRAGGDLPDEVRAALEDLERGR